MNVPADVQPGDLFVVKNKDWFEDHHTFLALTVVYDTQTRYWNCWCSELMKRKLVLESNLIHYYTRVNERE